MVQSSIGQLVSTYVWALRGASLIFMKIPNHVSSIEISRHPTFSLTKTWEQKLQILVSHASILMNKATSQHCTLRARCKLFNESPNLKWIHDIFFSKSYHNSNMQSICAWLCTYIIYYILSAKTWLNRMTSLQGLHGSWIRDPRPTLGKSGCV